MVDTLVDLDPVDLGKLVRVEKKWSIMPIIKIEIDPSHEHQQFNKTYEAAIRVLNERGILLTLDKLGVNTEFIARAIASEAVLLLHNNYEGDRRPYLRKLNAHEIRMRNAEIRNHKNKVNDLMKKYGLKKAQIYRIRNSE